MHLIQISTYLVQVSYIFQPHTVIIGLANKNEIKYTLEVIHYMQNLMLQRFFWIPTFAKFGVNL